MPRRNSLLKPARHAAFALLAAGVLLRADDDNSVIKPPPGYKTVYENVGGKQVPIFVQQQLDPLRHAGSMAADPLDHQKVFSETNLMSHKTYATSDSDLVKPAEEQVRDPYTAQVYNTTGPSSVYNIGTKSTYRTSAYAGLNAANGYGKNYATKDADVTPTDNAAAAFAAIGTPDEQNRTAPIDAKPIDVFDAPMAHKTAMTAAADNTVHHKLGELGNGTALSQLPDRPLTIDEVKNLINHGFKPDLTVMPPPSSKPLNDPNYQPAPLRISPADANNSDNNGSSSDDSSPPAPRALKALDDDKDDPVPPPGTMAEPPPENSERLPSK